jgi:hypothetical protein
VVITQGLKKGAMAPLSKANANSTKAFFVQMITRNISLENCAQANEVLLDPVFWHDPIPGTVDNVVRKSWNRVDFNDAGH